MGGRKFKKGKKEKPKKRIKSGNNAKQSLAEFYDFSKHEASHYEGIDRSFGTIILAKSYDKVLLIASKSPGGTVWGFPKGHRNDKETGIDAAIREIKEETDLDIEEGEFLLNDAGDQPAEFKVSYPWNYGWDIARFHIEKVKKKQQKPGMEKERPYMNYAGPIQREIILYLVPISMEKPIPQYEEGVAAAEWLTWDVAFRKMLDSKSIHIHAFIDAFKYLKKIGRIPDNTELPILSDAAKKEIDERIKEEADMMAKPIKDWPPGRQPPGWQEMLEGAEPSDDATTDSTTTHIDNIVIEEDDMGDDSEAEESETEKKKGGADSFELFWLFVFVLIGLILIIFYAVHAHIRSGYESYKQWMRFEIP